MENAQLAMDNERLRLGDMGTAYRFPSALSFPRSALILIRKWFSPKHEPLMACKMTGSPTHRRGA